MSKFWKGFFVGTIATISLFLGILFYGISVSTNGGLKEPNVVQINERVLVSQLKLRNLKTLKEVNIPKDKLVFINIWQTWCGPCLMEMKSIENLYRHYKNNKNVSFFIVSDEDISKIRNTVDEKKINLPFFINATNLPYEMDDESVPRTYIIFNGEIVMYEIGARKWDAPSVINFIDKTLQTNFKP